MELAVKNAQMLASLAHHGQKYGGKSYMYHLRQVVNLAKQYGLGTNRIIVSWLHDIIEDTEITEEFLRRVFNSDISRTVEKLTRKTHQNNVDYFNDIRLSSTASEVKYLDRIANLQNLKASQTKLIEKYKSEHYFMRSLSPQVRNKKIVADYEKLAKKIFNVVTKYTKWNDQAVLEFARVASGGSYGDYEKCTSLEAKISRFKELNFISNGNE